MGSENASDSFSTNYVEARDKFVRAAADAGATLDGRPHPVRGPGGEELTTDYAWLGPRDAARVVVLISGTHGVEGYCGSGAQIEWLRRREAARLPQGTAALLIHAINPYGFAWNRRVTHENVDLNRNWIDFTQPLPSNSAYERLSDALCPPTWDAESQRATGAALDRFRVEHGMAAFQQGVSGGQYTHPHGIFFGGRGPTWSRRTQADIFAEMLGHARNVAVVDYHTGLGAWGVGEQIVPMPIDSPAFVRARRWLGSAVTSTVAGTSTSSHIAGDGLNAAVAQLPHAEVTCVALEFGTIDLMSVLGALRADAWLHAHGDVDATEGRTIQRQMRDAFYGDRDDWRGMVVGQSLLVTRQMVAGLAEA